ncbi:MAG: hypothetical protein A3D65_02330 [Candidatus Lloydbacteria bacterium RIFCSPHIGHO2_02_FULL_50_13]|uniref:Uncharacterized protein n=1 Tax=Candidatus Lloydbacteria bacterium RIFCSPHIGHO2_02_FULL_50_13 TaxID=1798661 RepID=A0A1G2D2J8_9BACT|nr:MAG: hypothetical protein A3D65_02330 [Candidatus Lloydbacteria bacterium RIFCSPHIGHO2_02_FULL_50_13]
MEALKRCAISVVCIFFAVLASAGMVWCDIIFKSFHAATFWEKFANVWLVVAVIAGFIAFVLLLIASVAVPFKPAEATLEIFK